VLGKRLRGEGSLNGGRLGRDGGSLDPTEVVAQFAQHWRSRRTENAAGGLTFGEEGMVPVEAPLGVHFRERPPATPRGRPPPLLPRTSTSDRAICAGRLSADQIFTLEGLALHGGATCSAYSPYDLPDESMIRHRMQVLAHEHALRGVSAECATLVNAAVKQHMSTILRQCVNLSSQLGHGRTVRCLCVLWVSVGHKNGPRPDVPCVVCSRYQPEQGTAPATTSSASIHGTSAGPDAALQKRPPITCRDLLTALEVRNASIEIPCR
jgi:hypothetical protein